MFLHHTLISVDCNHHRLRYMQLKLYSGEELLHTRQTHTSFIQNWTIIGSDLVPTCVPTFPNPVLGWPNRPEAVPKPVAVLV